jgi:hypothetical protein
MTGKTDNTGEKKAAEAVGSSTPLQNPPAQLTDGKDAVAGGATQQRMVRNDGGNWPLLMRTNYTD